MKTRLSAHAFAALTAFAVGACIAQSTSTPAASGPAAFEAVTIKPNNSGRNGGAWGVGRNEYTSKNVPVAYVILQAYLGFSVPLDRLKGAPSWVTTDPYDIVAKADDATADTWKGKKQRDQVALAAPLLRAMLEDRLKLRVHTEPIEVQAYALVIGKHGSKLKEAQPDEPKPTGAFARFEGGWMLIYPQPGDTNPVMGYRQVTMQDFTQFLGMSVPVIDQTGLAGKYDFDLPRLETIAPPPPPDSAASASPPPPAVPDLSRMFDWNAVGLALKPIKVPGFNLVIDHIERPSEN